MPRILDEQEYAPILSAVSRHADGIGIDELSRLLAPLPRRTLQRRLSTLVAQQRLIAQGKGPARKYLGVVPAPVPTHPRIEEPGPEGAAYGIAEVAHFPLSAAGNIIRQQVRRPRSARQPVGYNAAFLNAYVPNETAYLSGTVREKLQRLGRSPDDGRAAGTYARHVLGRLLVDLSWASSRLEGNTYTRLDTQNLIDFGLAAEGKDQIEAQMILNHKRAIEMLVENADTVGFNTYTFRNLHALLSENLMSDAGAEGRIRRIPVEISGSVYLPSAIPQQIEECFHRILQKADAINDAFEQAFFILVHVPYLQPFEDVNKRVSRLAANIPLIRDNLSPLSFVDVLEGDYVDAMLGVYELNQVDLLADLFVWAYERSCRRYTILKNSLPEPDVFRMKYRSALGAVVQAVVLERASIEASDIRRRARPLVAEPDLPAFVAMVINELHHLHDGNIARYGLRLNEFNDWRPRRHVD